MEKYLEGLTPTETTDYSLWKTTAKLKKIQDNIRKNSGLWTAKAQMFEGHLSNIIQPFPLEMSYGEEDF